MLDIELIENIKKIIYDKYIKLFEKGGGQGYRYYHALRVYEIALRYVKEENISVDINALAISCLLHDIGKINLTNGNELIYDIKEEEHCNIGSKIVEDILLDLNVSIEVVKKVKNIILKHHDINSEIVEVNILQHCDDLDELGLLNVWRMFSYSNQEKRSSNHTVEYWHSVKIEVLEKIEKNFSIKFFKDLAIKRFHKCDNFINEFEKELKSKD